MGSPAHRAGGAESRRRARRRGRTQTASRSSRAGVLAEQDDRQHAPAAVPTQNVPLTIRSTCPVVRRDQFVDRGIDRRVLTADAGAGEETADGEEQERPANAVATVAKVDGERDEKELLAAQPVREPAEEKRAEQAPATYTVAAWPIWPSVILIPEPSSVRREEIVPTIVTSRPSRIQTVPSPTSTIQCQRAHGNRSSRAGILVSMIRPSAGRLCSHRPPPGSRSGISPFRAAGKRHPSSPLDASAQPPAPARSLRAGRRRRRDLVRVFFGRMPLGLFALAEPRTSKR